MSTAVDVVAIIELVTEPPEENGDEEGGWVIGRIGGDGILAGEESETPETRKGCGKKKISFRCLLAVGAEIRAVKLVEAARKV